MSARGRRSGVEDLWVKTTRNDDGTTSKVPSKLHGKGSRWRARYVDAQGLEHTKAFARKSDAQRKGVVVEARLATLQRCDGERNALGDDVALLGTVHVVAAFAGCLQVGCDVVKKPHVRFLLSAPEGGC